MTKDQILFDELYGTNLGSRIDKLQEECQSVVDAYDNYTDFPSPKLKSELVDELADLYAVLIHTASILDHIPEQLSLIAFEKSVKRINNPKFKRK